MGDEEVKVEEQVEDVIVNFDDSNITDLLNDISSNQEKLIEHFYPEYTDEEIKSFEEEIENEKIFNEKLENALDIIIEKEEELEQESEQDILVSTIQEDLALTNSYLYTINVYFAGFFIIVIGYILTKLLIGFFKPFL